MVADTPAQNSYFAQFAPPMRWAHLWSLAGGGAVLPDWPWLLLLGFGARQAPRPHRLDAATLLADAVSGGPTIGAALTAGYDPTRVYDGPDTRAFAVLIGAAWPSCFFMPSSPPGRDVTGNGPRSLTASG